jgi:hypothetical protein
MVPGINQAADAYPVFQVRQCPAADDPNGEIVSA